MAASLLTPSSTTVLPATAGTTPTTTTTGTTSQIQLAIGGDTGGITDSVSPPLTATPPNETPSTPLPANQTTAAILPTSGR